MTSGDGRPARLALPAFLVACVATAVAAVAVAAKRPPPGHAAAPAPIPVSVPIVSGPSIAAEAEVFRTNPEMLAIKPTTRRERQAHPRTLKTYRYLRAYPGAPPRIPHGLTPAEFRTGACNTCHERGGYSLRFEAYVPVTPHPERTACLQCHVGDDAVTGRGGAAPNARCHVCHGSGGPPRPYDNTGLDWQTTAWPPLRPRPHDGTPPPISHALEARGNCLPCHAGPSAVAEIRTEHPQWADCRQCHVTPNPEVDDFTRPASDAARGSRGSGGGR
jgi:cytochrome c-type protein NapB